jgi:class 3 adenylate cyclase
VTRETREDAPDDAYRWSRAPARRLKGVEGRVQLYRVRPATDDDEGDDNG